jgi:hypothetical protein
MKKTLTLLAAALLGIGIFNAQAQPGGHAAGGPGFDAAFSKLFGDNQAFTAALEVQTPDPSSGKSMTMPGKLSFDSGKSRFEMNTADIKGGAIPPGAAAQMKAMGMDVIVTITVPEKKISYLIYPGMQSYVENPITKGGDDSPDDFKIETTEIGKEIVDGHDCVKNKVVVTGKDGTKHESTVWSATDLKKFPIKIESNEQGQKVSLLFKDVSFKKPDAGMFEVQSGFTKYTNVQSMMQEVIMKKMGGAAGRPPGQ